MWVSLCVFWKKKRNNFIRGLSMHETWRDSIAAAIRSRIWVPLKWDFRRILKWKAEHRERKTKAAAHVFVEKKGRKKLVVEIWQHNGILNVVLLFPINSMSVGQRASNLHENHMQMQPTFRSPRLRAVEALPNFSFLCGSLSYQQCAISLSRPFFQDFQPHTMW